MISIDPRVNLFKADRLFVSDSSRVSGCDEPQVLQKQDPALKNVFHPNPPQFVQQVLRPGKSKVVCQGSGTYHRSIMKLYKVLGAGGSALSNLLKRDNGFNELWAGPRFGYPLRLP
jgi:hypothetical protein